MSDFFLICTVLFGLGVLLIKLADIRQYVGRKQISGQNTYKSETLTESTRPVTGTG